MSIVKCRCGCCQKHESRNSLSSLRAELTYLRDVEQIVGTTAEQCSNLRIANRGLRTRIKELVSVLKELADLMDDVRSGDYKPDSFTTQPARTAIARNVKNDKFTGTN